MQVIKMVDNEFYRILGNQLRRAREHRCMTQLELSKAVGISRPILVNYEYGYTRISCKRWKRICEVLDIDENILVDVTINYRNDRHN